MKKAFATILFLAVMGCMDSAVHAAELLDVKPVVVGNSVSFEISADIAMTYTYYKVPGQPRAVVDIAEADPEKVEPLIVVNKGVVSSISVDKAQISGIVVSRVIFNLVSEADISVSASPDRKQLTVTFGGSSSATAKPEPKPVKQPEPVVKDEPPAIVATAPPAATPKEEDPLGLDEPVAKSAVTAAAAAATAAEAPLLAAPSVMRIPKLEPVVPVPTATVRSTALTVTLIATGESFIEIHANQPIGDYKTSRMSSPERLVIDIAGAKIQQKPKSILINKFGITKARIGVSPKNIRIVFDSSKASFPANTITNIENGLRITFR